MLRRRCIDSHAKEKQGEAGFSLLELMVSVVIVAIMISVITPELMGATRRASTTACDGNVRTITAALSEYSLIHQSLPTGNTTQQIQALVTDQLLSKDALNGSYAIDDSDASNITVTCPSIENAT